MLDAVPAISRKVVGVVWNLDDSSTCSKKKYGRAQQRLVYPGKVDSPEDRPGLLIVQHITGLLAFLYLAWVT